MPNWNSDGLHIRIVQIILFMKLYLLFQYEGIYDDEGRGGGEDKFFFILLTFSSCQYLHINVGYQKVFQQYHVYNTSIYLPDHIITLIMRRKSHETRWRRRSAERIYFFLIVHHYYTHTHCSCPHRHAPPPPLGRRVRGTPPPTRGWGPIHGCICII